MKTSIRFDALALVLLASAALVACTNEAPPVDDHGHEHAPGEEHEGDHGHEHDDVHEGEPVVIHDGAAGAYSGLHVTWYRPATTPVTELVFEIALAGPASTVRGSIRSASGATSLVTRAEAESTPGAFHLHCGELPADIGTADVLVLELEPTGAAAQTLELPLVAK
jgi:hypothetical protein